MTVVNTASATDDLDEIWRWNARHRSPAQANEYLAFLRSEIDELASKHASGQPVPNRPGCFYNTIRRKTRGHGHVAVYRTAGTTVIVMRVFHTAQNWQATFTP